MRIAFVYDALYPYVRGGAERRYHELGLRLRDAHDVHFVSWRWWEGPSRTSIDGMTFHGVGRPPALYGTDGKRTVREAAAFAARIVPTLLRNRFDVIDFSATPYLPLYAAWPAALLRRSRMVATWHELWGDHWADYLGHRPLVARAAAAVEAGSRFAGHRIVAVSDFTARRMGMADDPRLTVVGNGVPLSEIEAAPTGERVDVLFVGRLIEDKRVDLLLEAVDLLRERVPALSCSIVGDGPQLTALQEWAAALGVADRVRFHGFVPGSDVFSLMKGARILIQPSVREGFAMTVAEAQACGAVPVVVRSAMSAAPDLIAEGATGLVVDPSALALADGIAGLLGAPRRLNAMSRAARLAGAERDWALVAGRMARVYEEVVAAPRMARAIGRLEWS
jgi:glycosyltransferase involved in cell wall biosynthesis